MTFGARLKDLRALKGITQNELAAATGLSHGCVAMLEVNKRAPTGQTLALLADFFEVSTDYLLGRADDFGVISFANVAQELTSEERELLEYFRKLNTLNRMHVSAYAKVRFEDQTSGAGGRRA